MKKQAKPELFNILGGLVNRRVFDLRATVKRAVGAKERIGQLQNQIDNSQRYIDNNRYDREEVQETKSEIAQYEQEIRYLNKNISDAERAQSELNAAARFYEIQKEVKNHNELEQLKKEYNELLLHAWDLEELEFNCEINTDSSYRSEDLCNQMYRDKMMYHQEYNRVMEKVSWIEARMRELCK